MIINIFKILNIFQEITRICINYMVFSEYVGIKNLSVLIKNYTYDSSVLM